jgi:hypothetical protein
MRKIIGIIIVTLLVASGVFPVTGSSGVHKNKASNYKLNTTVRHQFTYSNNENSDLLDQNQSDYCGWSWVVWSPEHRLAQSFKPTLNIISRVELLLLLIGNPGKIEISIRSELSGPDLTSIIVLGNNISGFQEHWADFDFPDISVESDKTYYIIWSTIDTNSTNYFAWGYGDNNPYDNGDAYIYSPALGWQINEGTANHPDIDFCFRTYGIHNYPPNILTINGPPSGEPEIIYDYDFSNCVDPNNDDMTYHVEWGDGAIDEGIVESGGAFTLPHGWKNKGDYQITAKLIDAFGAESDWATFEITMPKPKTQINPFIRFLENHPRLFPILRLLLT